MTPIRIITLTIIIICSFCNGADQAGDEGGESVFLSPKCSAVILSGGIAGGAGVAYALTPTALCTAGFCRAGISASSFVSWWQSTMPLVKAGGIFATLQGVAMGEIGSKVVVSESVLGGAIGVKYLTELCAYVDDPDSKMAPAFDAALMTVRVANAAAYKAKATCSASESCMAVADFASSSASSLWKYISEGASQAGKTIASKTEIWILEEKVKKTKEQIKDLKESTYTGQLIETVGDCSWADGYILGSGVWWSLSINVQSQEGAARLRNAPNGVE